MDKDQYIRHQDEISVKSKPMDEFDASFLEYGSDYDEEVP